MRRSTRKIFAPADTEQGQDDLETVARRNASIDEIERAEVELRRLVAPPMPPPPSASEPPPPPPAPSVVNVPPALDVWLIPIQVFSFDATIIPGRASPLALFGARDPAAGSRHSERRVADMARWLRAQPDAPWGWVDGQTRMIGNAFARWHREMPGSKTEMNAFDHWRTALERFETELEARIRAYLGQTSGERGRAAALDESRRSGGAPSAVAVAASLNAMPRFDPGSFVAQMGRRGVRVELDEQTRRPAFRGPGAGLGAADYQTLERHRSEIGDHLAALGKAWAT